MDDGLKTILLALIGSVTTIALAYIAARWQITKSANKSDNEAKDKPIT